MDDDDPVEVPETYEFGGVEIGVKDAERFIDAVRNNKDLQYLFAVISGLEQEAVDSTLHQVQGVTNDEMHFARGTCCNARVLTNIPALLQEWLEARRAYLKAQSDLAPDA